MKKKLNIAFEKRWKELIDKSKEDHNKRHKSRLGKWFFEPNYHDPTSIQHRFGKALAKNFFIKGTLFYQEHIIKQLELKEDKE